MIDERYMGNNENTLYLDAESRTNRANTRCLVVLAAILLVSEILNEIDVFEVAPSVMRIGVAFGMLFYLMPAIVLYRPLQICGRNAETLTYRGWHKYFIMICTWLGTAASCVMLTHHTVIVMAVPIMIMAQYRNTKKMVILTSVFATLCVLLGVYGGFFFGCFDGNLLQTALTDENVNDLAMRANLGTKARMVELFTHYALARELVVIGLVLLAYKISERNDEMLRRQSELQNAVAKEMQRKNEIQWQIIDSMANLIENRDANTGEHVKRTSFYVDIIAERLRTKAPYSSELSEKRIETIVRAAPLHDIGKVVVADRILQKPGRLTQEEYEEIKLHSAEGERVIRNVLGNVEDDDFLQIASEIAGGHHERWDGRGYPNEKKGTEIPLSARIMAIADVFDALVSERVYKSPMPPEEAFNLIEAESGKQFDPEVVKAFLSLKPKIMEYLEKETLLDDR